MSSGSQDALSVPARGPGDQTVQGHKPALVASRDWPVLFNRQRHWFPLPPVVGGVKRPCLENAQETKSRSMGEERQPAAGCLLASPGPLRPPPPFHKKESQAEFEISDQFLLRAPGGSFKHLF